MSLLESIKRNRRQRILNRLADRPHHKRLPNLEEVRTIGLILPPALDNDEKLLVDQFEYHMRKRNIGIETLTLPAQGSPAMDWLGLPAHHSIEQFTRQPFDILVVATDNDNPAALFVVLNSRSTLRVAYDDTTTLADPISTKTYDLFIRGHEPFNLSYLLVQLLTFLHDVNKKSS